MIRIILILSILSLTLSFRAFSSFGRLSNKVTFRNNAALDLSDAPVDNIDTESSDNDFGDSSMSNSNQREQGSSIYVGNIPFEVSEGELIEIIDSKDCSDYSSVRLVIDKNSGMSRGFGYVNFDDKAIAEGAVDKLQDISVNGRNLRVELSLPMSERKTRDRRDGGERRQRQPDRNDAMSIFVGNLDFNVGEEDLRDLVEEALGDGSVQLIRLATNRDTGRPRGFGHVVFHEEEMVEKAISALNDKEFFGRNLRVDKAQRKGDQPNKHSVYLGNLAWDVSEDLVKEMIDDVVGEGLYTSVRVAVDRETGRHRGFGYVDFIEKDVAERAVAELNGLEVLGRQIRADHAVRNSDRRGGGGRQFNNNRGNRGGYGGGRDNYGGGRDNYNNDGGDGESMSFE